MLGPALPPGFRRAAYSNDDDNDGEDGESFPGPALPPDYQAEASSSEGEDEDEDVIGPMPAKGPVQDSVALDFERRAQRMKEKLTGEVSAHLQFTVTYRLISQRCYLIMCRCKHTNTVTKLKKKKINISYKGVMFVFYAIESFLPLLSEFVPVCISV